MESWRNETVDIVNIWICGWFQVNWLVLTLLGIVDQSDHGTKCVRYHNSKHVWTRTTKPRLEPVINGAYFQQIGERGVVSGKKVKEDQSKIHYVQPCGITMETTFRISFFLTYRLTVKLFTLFVESGLGQHAIGFLKLCLGILSRLVLSGPSTCFHLERSVIQTNKTLQFLLLAPLYHTSYAKPSSVFLFHFFFFTFF